MRVFRWRRLGIAATLSVSLVFVATSMPRFVRAAVRPLAGAHVPHARQSLTAQSLVAQTLNVFGLPWPAGHEVASRCLRTAAAIAESAPDFVALQEVWDETSREPLLVRGYHAAFSESPQGLLGQNGLLTLSRHAIAGADSYCFRSATGLEAWVGKGALCTVVTLPDGARLAIWNVHLQSGRDGGAVRGEQIRELAGWIRNAPERCRIVLGDFNCSPGDAEWNDLELEFEALGLARRSGEQATYDHRRNPLAAIEPPAAIDHVFVDAQVHAAAAPARAIHDRPRDGVFLSDHFGLEVRLPVGLFAAAR